MKLIFAGTPDFATESLKAILGTRHQVVLTLTQPDRPSGRGMGLQPSQVKQVSQAFGIPVLQPETLKNQAVQETISSLGADAMIVAAYGLILPQSVLNMPRLGCFNIHASLLPRWRGAAPIQRAILAGDAETGVCIMRMEAGLDTGPILLSESLPITPMETAGSLHDKLAALGGKLIVRALEQLPMRPIPQVEEGATYAAKLEKSEARLDWRLSAEELDRRVRAFNPFPGANFVYSRQTIKVWKSLAEFSIKTSQKPGTLLSADKDGLVVACGSGALRLLEIQKAGGRRLPISEFLAGNPFPVGDVLDAAA